MTGEVSVMVTCIFGSVEDVRTMAASWTDPFTSYFSGVTILKQTQTDSEAGEGAWLGLWSTMV